MVRRDDGKSRETWADRTLKGEIPTTFNDELAGGLNHWVPKPTDALKKK
jgi:dihydropyrimidine dehydrogenase (NAD+) subunit PreA